MANEGQVILFPRGKGIKRWLTQRKNWKSPGPVLPLAQLGGLMGFSSPSPLPMNCGSYFIIWSGTGLFLNLGCSSKTGWTVKHWMSGIPAVKGSQCVAGCGTVPNIAGPR